MIPFSKGTVNSNEVFAIKEVIKSGWLTTGKVTAEFEKKFAEYVGAKHAIFLSSGTAALALALQWQTKKYQDVPIVVPSYTFIATVSEIIRSGNRPVFHDISMETFSLPNNLYTKHPLLKVHLTGCECKAKSEQWTIEDSAHRIERNQCLNNSNIVCFSFYPTKNMTTGEGGMIATNDAKAANWFHQARNHGINKSDKDRYGKGQWRYAVEFLSSKYNNTDIAAAIGLEQLKCLPWMTKERNKIVKIYNRELGLKRKGNHLYPIFVENRKKFFETVADSEVQFSVHFLPIHKMNFLKNKKLLIYKNLKNTEWCGEHEVSIPLYPSLKEKEIEKIISVIKKSKCLIKV